MSGLFVGNDIRMILDSLPTDETEHMRRVGLYVDILAGNVRRSGLYAVNTVGTDGKDPFRVFGEAASFHDIGKAFVPARLLMKPGMLSDEETSLMRMHPQYANRLFTSLKRCNGAGIPDALFDLAHASAIYHHEWWNGQGYPHQIGYEKIPLIARMTSICDAYDAITSNRVYMKAHSHAYACREISVQSGVQFDPLLVALFLDLEEEFSTLQSK